MQINAIIDDDWKYSAIIDFPCDDSKFEDFFQYEFTCIRIFVLANEESNYVLSEVYAKKEKYNDISEAYFGLQEVLERFLHRLALTTFRRVRILKSTGITQYKVNLNTEFDLLIPDVLDPVIEGYNNMKFSNISNLTKSFSDIEINDALREVKFSLESNQIYRKFHHYYNAIERLATLETVDFVQRKCEKCGFESQIEIKATANKMLEFFMEEGFSKKQFKKCRSLRGKIAHGSGKQEQNAINSIRQYLGVVEKVAINKLSDLSGIKILKGTIPRIHAQLCHIKGVKTAEKTNSSNAEYNIVDISFEASFSFNKVEDSLDDSGEIRPLMTPIPLGITPENFRIFPYSWPY